MARWFRVVDCTRHCGMPTKTACIVFGILTAICNGYTCFWLPVIPAIILMVFAAITGLIAIVAAARGVRALAILYVVCAILLEIPVLVVIGYVSFTLASYENCYVCLYPGRYFYCTWSVYQQSLCQIEIDENGWLWSAIIIAFIACIFGSIALGGFRKLRLQLAGASTVVTTRGGRVVGTQGVVVQQSVPAPTVYNVPTTTVVTAQTQPTVYMQHSQQQVVYGQPQQPVMYTQPPPAYEPAQGVNYNPPHNPAF